VDAWLAGWGEEQEEEYPGEQLTLVSFKHFIHFLKS